MWISYLIVNFDSDRISWSHDHKIFRIFEMWLHWKWFKIRKCVWPYFRYYVYILHCFLLLGFLAQTISEGVLGSPAPDALMAITLNSYSDPSDTSFTPYFSPVRIWDSGHLLMHPSSSFKDLTFFYSVQLEWYPFVQFGLPLIGSLTEFRVTHWFVCFLRFSIWYPKILFPPSFSGGVHDRLIQFLKALTTFGGVGGPGNTTNIININITWYKYPSVWKMYLVKT